MAETIKKVSKQCKSVLSNQELDEGQGKVIQSKMEELENQFKALLALTKKRQVLLEDSLSFYELIQVTQGLSLNVYIMFISRFAGF